MDCQTITWKCHLERAGLPREFMGPRANLRWGALAYNWHIWVVCRCHLVNFVDIWNLEVCPGKIFRIRPFEIEFENNFSSISQHLRSTESVALKIWEIDPLRLNVRLISAVYHNNLVAIFLSDWWELDHWDWIWEWFQQ